MQQAEPAPCRNMLLANSVRKAVTVNAQDYLRTKQVSILTFLSQTATRSRQRRHGFLHQNTTCNPKLIMGLQLSPPMESRK